MMLLVGSGKGLGSLTTERAPTLILKTRALISPLAWGRGPHDNPGLSTIGGRLHADHRDVVLADVTYYCKEQCGFWLLSRISK